MNEPNKEDVQRLDKVSFEILEFLKKKTNDTSEGVAVISGALAHLISMMNLPDELIELILENIHESVRANRKKIGKK